MGGDSDRCLSTECDRPSGLKRAWPALRLSEYGTRSDLFYVRVVICTRFKPGIGTSVEFIASWLGEWSALAIMFADGIPVRAEDFSQSREDGPRILPSM